MVLAGIGAAMHFAAASAGAVRRVGAAGAFRAGDRISVTAVPVDRLADSVPAVPVDHLADSVPAVPVDHLADSVPAVPVDRLAGSVPVVRAAVALVAMAVE
jgi:hypothetical protein